MLFFRIASSPLGQKTWERRETKNLMSFIYLSKEKKIVDETSYFVLLVLRVMPK